jgi:transposase-like protein
MEVFMAKSKVERGRFSSRKKMDVVLRVLRGDDLDVVSREAGITAATVSAWRDQVVASGQAGLKSRAADGSEVAPLWPPGVMTCQEVTPMVRSWL